MSTADPGLKEKLKHDNMLWVEKMFGHMYETNTFKTIYFDAKISLYTKLLHHGFGKFLSAFHKDDIKNEIELSFNINELYEKHIKYLISKIKMSYTNSRIIEIPPIHIFRGKASIYLTIGKDDLVVDLLINVKEKEIGYCSYQIFNISWCWDEENEFYYPSDFKFKCIASGGDPNHDCIFGRTDLFLSGISFGRNRCGINNVKYKNLKNYEFFKILNLLENYIESINYTP
jgi:hypothetical protein